MRRDSLFTIAPHAPFLPTLVDRVLDGTLLRGWKREGAFWLSDVTIILPTRRSRLALAAEFAQRLGGVVLLPNIRTFGGEHAEEEPFLPPYDMPATAPAASPLERRLALSGLVRAFAERAGSFATPPNASEVFWLADSLGTVIDDLTIEGVAATALRELVPDDLAGNWQQILDFLNVVLEAWPAVLAERGKTDAAAARNERLARQADAAIHLYGDKPVIAAGSTGSIPATANLLAAIADLPRGALLLPGLDTSFTPEQHDIMLKGEVTQGHPQFGLMKLLRHLGAAVSEVTELAGDHPRTTLVRAALAPAVETPAWATMRAALPVATALDGASILAAPNADTEARAIALAARATLAEGKTVGIIARDQTLARRISVELKRYDVIVDDAAGTPLYQSGAGRLARQILAVATGNFAAVDTVALLRNAAVTLGRDRQEVWRAADDLDWHLRRERPKEAGLPGLQGLGKSEIKSELLAALGAGLAPVTALVAKPSLTAADLAAALVAAMGSLIGYAGLPGIDEFRRWAEEVAGLTYPGASFPPLFLDSVLSALLAGATAQAPPSERDDIAIWGELEARLQSPDLMILAGVNEDIWPPVADPGPWLSRGMRVGIGLEPPERRQGQAAHDFAMAVGNANVLIAYARRIGTSPALPSPLLQRLDAFIGTDAAQMLRARGARWLAEAEAIDHAGIPRPAPRPVPNPPAKDRPRRLSITEIEPLMRSPYDIYAKHVLGLRRLEPLGTEPSARERGTMIHGVFEQAVADRLDLHSREAFDKMMGMAEQAFAGLDAIKERRDIWLKRFERAAVQFLAYERGRDDEVAERHAEKKGEWRFPGIDFTLVGKADRLDIKRDGTLEIIDFKTGGVPAPKDMTAFDAPQLLLEAAMARAGIFEGIGPRDSSELTYIKIGLGPAAFQVKPFKLRNGMALMDAVDEIVRRTQSHVDAFLLHQLPMTARIRPRIETGRKSYPGDYDHLARTDEWTLTAGVDDP